MKLIFNWKTKKENGTYTAIVYTTGHNVPTKIVKRVNGFKTRARATTFAKRVKMHMANRKVGMRIHLNSTPAEILASATRF